MSRKTEEGAEVAIRLSKIFDRNCCVRTPEMAFDNNNNNNNNIYLSTNTNLHIYTYIIIIQKCWNLANCNSQRID